MTEVASSRRRRAIAIVALLTLIPVVAAGALRCSGEDHALWEGEVTGNGFARRIWEQVAFGEDVEEAIDDMGFKRIDAGGLPEWFEEEVMPISMLEGARATPGFELVGFSSPMAPADAMDQMDSALRSRGWKVVDEGYDHICTYMKSKGECTWLMVECTQSGDETAGVLHIRRS